MEKVSSHRPKMSSIDTVIYSSEPPKIVIAMHIGWRNEKPLVRISRPYAKPRKRKPARIGSVWEKPLETRA